MAEESVRDTLMATIAEGDKSASGTPAPGPGETSAPAAPTPPAGTPAAPAPGYLAGTPAAPAAPAAPSTTPAATPGAPADPVTEVSKTGEVQQVLNPIKAPGTWSPAAREHWGTLPAEVQAEIAKRESETSRVMTQSTQARRLQAQFQQLVQPHLPFFAADGVDPLTGINNVMQQAATLRVGSVEQKAKMVAGLIQHFKVDIDMLDQLLAGQTPTPGQGGFDPNQLGALIDQRLAPITQQFQQHQQRMLAEVSAEVDTELTEFGSKHEFYNDVKDVMADLMQVAMQRGINMGLTDAYERATLLVPSVREVLKQRETVNAAKSQHQLAQKAKAGGFGIQNSAETVVATPAGDDSIRGLLTAQFAASQQGGR
jgi:hypothetical protein